MSTKKTFLVLVFTDRNPKWRDEFLIFDEEDGVFTVAEIGIGAIPYRRERHLFFELSQPLSEEQLAKLEKYKRTGLSADFFVCNELCAISLLDSLASTSGGNRCS